MITKEQLVNILSKYPDDAEIYIIDKNGDYKEICFEYNTKENYISFH